MTLVGHRNYCTVYVKAILSKRQTYSTCHVRNSMTCANGMRNFVNNTTLRTLVSQLIGKKKEVKELSCPIHGSISEKTTTRQDISFQRYSGNPDRLPVFFVRALRQTSSEDVILAGKGQIVKTTWLTENSRLAAKS